MENKRFKPKLDKLFWAILIPTSALMLTLTVITALSFPVMLFFTVPIDLFIAYFMISPLFGYVELRENSVFIKFGFILKREIPYNKVRGAQKEKKMYSESMISLKNAIEHVNIKYNTFDIVTVSVKGNDELIAELSARL